MNPTALQILRDALEAHAERGNLTPMGAYNALEAAAKAQAEESEVIGWICGECGAGNPTSRVGCRSCGEHCDDRCEPLFDECDQAIDYRPRGEPIK